MSELECTISERDIIYCDGLFDLEICKTCVFGYFINKFHFKCLSPAKDKIGIKKCDLPNDNSNSDYDPVNKPQHYVDGNVECIDAMIQVFGTEAVKSFCLCNAFKYHWRHNLKNGAEDIQKATWYMDKYKELTNE